MAKWFKKDHQCTPKKGYSTFKEAERAWRGVKKNNKRSRYWQGDPQEPGTMKPYRCRYCNKWHLGHRRNN